MNEFFDPQPIASRINATDSRLLRASIIYGQLQLGQCAILFMALEANKHRQPMLDIACDRNR